MTPERAVSLRELAFVRDVLIPRCAWLEGPEVGALVQLRLRIDAIFATAQEASGKDPAEKEQQPCS